mmetsp:Transcript_9113/g.24808  ORF Transcript_9113/g.24808 Transcript_9113/m.24808 type:complete len:228 (-) Transcript_9113:494-1177(-)
MSRATPSRLDSSAHASLGSVSTRTTKFMSSQPGTSGGGTSTIAAAASCRLVSSAASASAFALTASCASARALASASAFTAAAATAASAADRLAASSASAALAASSSSLMAPAAVVETLPAPSPAAAAAAAAAPCQPLDADSSQAMGLDNFHSIAAAMISWSHSALPASTKFDASPAPCRFKRTAPTRSPRPSRERSSACRYSPVFSNCPARSSSQMKNSPPSCLLMV